MPGFTGFNLPPAGPTIGGQLTQALGQFPTQIADAQKQKLELQQQKQQLEMNTATLKDAQRKTALDQLMTLSRMGQADSTGARYSDPAFVKSVKDQANAAGLQGVTHIDPATGMEVVDPAAFKAVTNGKLLSDLTPEEHKLVEDALPGQQRKSVLESLNVDLSTVPPDVLTAQPTSTFAQRTDVITKFQRAFDNLPVGKQNLAGITETIAAWAPQLQAAGGSISDIENVVNSDAFQQQTLAPAIQAQVDKMRAAGFKDDAIARYQEERTRLLPKEIMARVNYQNGMLTVQQGRLGVAQENADTNKTRASQSYALGQQRIQIAQGRLADAVAHDKIYAARTDAYIKQVAAGTNIAAAKSMIALRTPQINALIKQRDEVNKQITTMMTNSPNDTDGLNKLLDQQAALSGTIDAASAGLQELQNNINAGENKALQNRNGGKPIGNAPRDYINPADFPPTWPTSSTGRRMDPDTRRVYNADGTYTGETRPF